MPCVSRIGNARRVFQRLTGERQKGNMAGALDGSGYHALMFGACAGLAARPDLAFIGDVFPQQISFFIVYYQAFIGAELAEFWFGKEAALGRPNFSVFMIFSHCLLHFLS